MWASNGEERRYMYSNSKIKPYIGGIIFSLLVGFSFVGVKISLNYASTLEVLTYRYNFAILAVLIIIWTGIGKIKIKNKPKKKIILIAITYILFMIFQTLGLYFSSSVESAILFSIIPILVQIMAEIFLKEKGSKLQNFFVILSVISLIYMIVLSSGSVSFNVYGITFLLMSSVCMACNNVLMRYVRDIYTPFEITGVIAILGCVSFNIIYMVQGMWNGTLLQYFEPLKSPQFIMATAYLGICCILFSSLLMAYMQSKLLSMEASIFGNVSTAISIVAGVIILGEKLESYYIICTGIIILGVVGISMSGRKINGEKY